MVKKQKKKNQLLVHMMKNWDIICP